VGSFFNYGVGAAHGSRLYIQWACIALLWEGYVEVKSGDCQNNFEMIEGCLLPCVLYADIDVE
jgi:hypothetical protein